jgi:RNA polymerase sigma-70 factor (ECF subfamily)
LLIRIRDPLDQDAWSQFFELYEPIVRAYCFQRKIQRADIDDIAQEVMSAVSAAIKKFEYDPGRGRFRAWFGTVTASKINSFMGKQNRNQGGSSCNGSPPIADQYVDPDTEWINIFSETVFRSACNRIRAGFSDSTWSSFEAIWMRNESAADVAVSLGIPVHSVYVNKSRVIKRLELEIRILADDMPIPRGD